MILEPQKIKSDTVSTVSPSICHEVMGQTVRTGHGTTDWFQIEKRVCQGCILSLCLCNICRVHHEKCWGGRSTSWNQDCRENINNLRYSDNINLMAESEEELKILLIKVKEESEKVGLKLNIQKTKIMTSGPITSWQMREKQ